MKERISGEINSCTSKGMEYATKTYQSATSLAKSIGRSFFGETILERVEGKWVPRTVRPGIRHIFRIRR